MIPFWKERLERLRREQDPRRYPVVDDRPVLQLPIPEPPRDLPEPSDGDEEPASRVIIIDL